jgi:hypothetical protein
MLDGRTPKDLNIYESIWLAVYVIVTTKLSCKYCPRFHIIVAIKEYNARRERGMATKNMEDILHKLR